MLGGALNATARELPFLNRNVNPYGDKPWAKILSNIASHAIRNGTDWWMHKRNPEDKNGSLD